MTPEISRALGFDPTNRAQVREVQQLMGVAATGRIDAATANALNRHVRAMQAVLLSQGHCDVGAIDGVMGPRTAAGMRDMLGAASLVTWLRQRAAA